MEADQKMQHRGYEYQITSSRKGDGMFQGVILLTAHAGIPYSKIIEILAPGAFKVEHSARVEATAIACQIIETGAVIALIPAGEKASLSPAKAKTPLL